MKASTTSRNKKFTLNTDTAIAVAEGTGRLGHYTTQGNWVGYVCRHRSGEITTAKIGSGYFASPVSGYDWENNGCEPTVYHNDMHWDYSDEENLTWDRDCHLDALIALNKAGLLTDRELIQAKNLR